MRSTLAALALALAAAGLAAGPALAQSAPTAQAKAGPKTKAAAASANCVTKYGKGWAWSLGGAKFQAWEIVAQTTGNWPFMQDKFRNEKYNCKPDGSGYTCYSRIDVCKG
jgi:hypothetical protein